MNRIEKVPDYRSSFEKANEVGKKKLVTELRDEAITYLEPLKTKILRRMAASTRKVYQEKGYNLEWDLTRYEDALEFRLSVRRSLGTSPLQKRASDLLAVCTRALDKETIPNYIREAILHAYAMLDSDSVEAGKKQSATQSKRARKPRVKTEDGTTLDDLCIALTKNLPNAKPSEAWPHMQSAIEEWAGACEEKTKAVGKKGKRMPYYRYPFGDGHRTIDYKQFGVRLRKAKDGKNTV